MSSRSIGLQRADGHILRSHGERGGVQVASNYSYHCRSNAAFGDKISNSIGYHDGSYASSYSSICCSTKCLSKWTVLHQRHWAVLQANCCTRQFISDNKNAYSGTTNRSTMAYAVSKDKRTNQISTCSTGSDAPACSLSISWSVMGKTWIKDLMAPDQCLRVNLIHLLPHKYNLLEALNKYN